MQNVQPQAEHRVEAVGVPGVATQAEATGAMTPLGGGGTSERPAVQGPAAPLTAARSVQAASTGTAGAPAVAAATAPP